MSRSWSAATAAGQLGDLRLQGGGRDQHRGQLAGIAVLGARVPASASSGRHPRWSRGSSVDDQPAVSVRHSVDRRRRLSSSHGSPRVARTCQLLARHELAIARCRPDAGAACPTRRNALSRPTPDPRADQRWPDHVRFGQVGATSRVQCRRRHWSTVEASRGSRTCDVGPPGRTGDAGADPSGSGGRRSADRRRRRSPRPGAPGCGPRPVARRVHATSSEPSASRACPRPHRRSSRARPGPAPSAAAVRASAGRTPPPSTSSSNGSTSRRSRTRVKAGSRCAGPATASDPAARQAASVLCLVDAEQRSTPGRAATAASRRSTAVRTRGPARAAPSRPGRPRCAPAAQRPARPRHPCRRRVAEVPRTWPAGRSLRTARTGHLHGQHLDVAVPDPGQLLDDGGRLPRRNRAAARGRRLRPPTGDQPPDCAIARCAAAARASESAPPEQATMIGSAGDTWPVNQVDTAAVITVCGRPAFTAVSRAPGAPRPPDRRSPPGSAGCPGTSRRR